jgi:uncharacterized protein YggU (UPF0235/DUF167 family)
VAADCYRIEPAGIVLAVRLTPRAAHDAIDGIRSLADGRPYAQARVRAVPEAGGANQALCALLARTFGVPKSSVSLVSGASARLKQVRIAGAPGHLREVVDAWPQSA